MPTLRLTRGSVQYELLRARRKTVGVTVRRDGAVEVRAPLRTSKREIQDVVEKFRPWIEKKRTEHMARERRLRARRFDHGNEVPYLGGALTLRVREVAGAPVEPPRRRGSTLEVRVAKGLSVPSRRAVIRHAVGMWLLGEAQRLFHERHVEAAKLVGSSAKKVVIKDMRSRWGSCGPSRRMSLNWRLIMAPLEVLDYVLVHELTHIFVDNHSKAFWRRVARAMPGYETSRDWLKQNGAELEL
jgi:predicted metal-dependent hydrolase